MQIISNKKKSSGIKDVRIEPLKQIYDARGSVLHMLRTDSELYSNFGEIYFSEILPGKIKAWKRHFRMTQNFVVPVGRIRLVFYDTRPRVRSNGQFETLILGRPDNYYIVQVPPLIWYGFQNIGNEVSLLVNCADMVHDPEEAELIDYQESEIPYIWDFSIGSAE